MLENSYIMFFQVYLCCLEEKEQKTGGKTNRLVTEEEKAVLEKNIH